MSLLSSNLYSPLSNPFFEDIIPRGWYDWNLLPSNVQSRDLTFQPRVDLMDTENEIIVQAEMPGMTKENIKVDMLGNVLTISGTKERSKDFEGQRFRRAERNFGDFQTRVRLPTGTDSEQIKTQLLNGVLEVRIPRPDEKQREQARKKIPIE